MTKFQEFEKQFILLCEAGFIAVNQFDEDAAVKLFKASQLLAPQNTLPQVGFGYMHLCKLELRQACEMFEQVLKKEPENEMAKAFLGIALSFLPNEVSKGEQMLDQVSQKSRDAQVKTLADTALEFVERFIKKSPTPMQPQPIKKKS
jgi:predicted TPR repeat methyltransferase